MIGIKRDREDDGETCQQYGDAKKLRSLPLRTSPTSQHPYLSFSSRPRFSHRPQTLTPAESEEDDSDLELVSPKDTQNRQAPLNLYLHDVSINEEDMDLDMDDSPQSMSDPVWSPQPPDSAATSAFSSSLLSRLDVPRPGSGKGGAINAQNARVPTPIYGHFTTIDTPSDKSVSTPPVAPPTSAALPHPRVRTSTNDSTENFFRRRALPSPISEDENMDSPTVMTKSMFSNLRMSTTPAADKFPQSELGMISPKSPKDYIPKHWASAPGLTMAKNRRRSDAISGGVGESGKVVFSMGFRADCEKCRERVPGHYSHVLRA